MTYVVLEECNNCKYTDCVDVCPVDAFHEGPSMLYINPVECIDCGVCIPECPIEAIAADNDLTDEQRYLLELNARGAEEYPVITEMDASRCSKNQ